MFLQSRPYTHYSCIRQQTHHDGTFLGSFFNREEGFTWYPTISDGFLKSLALTLAYNYIESVITQIASLTGPLNTVTDDCDSFIFQYFTRFFKRKFFTCHYFFNDTSKIHFCHFFVFFASERKRILNLNLIYLIDYLSE